MGHSSSHKISSNKVFKAQEILYKSLLSHVKRLESDEVLEEFKQLFIYQNEVRDPLALRAVAVIIQANDRQAFFYTLKRCCFILINNWGSARLYEPIHALISTINDAAIYHFTYSRSLKRLRRWLVDFVKSKEYESLQLFAERYNDGRGRWSQRYASYLLAAQYGDTNNPAEQREAARELSKQLRDRFRLDLAMYVAHSQVNPRTSSSTSEELAQREAAKNPTNLGDNVLRLIKMIVLRRGKYSYENLAQFFLRQTEFVSYGEYKNALLQYLVFSVDNQGFVQMFLKRLSEKLEGLYPERDGDRIDEELVFRTCNRVIEFLTTEDDENPAPLFNLLLSQGGPLTLVVVLLKLILVAPNTRNRLEYCIAKLIQYYEEYTSDDCHWFINFLEVFTVTFAIYVEDVQYNLVRISTEDGELADEKNGIDNSIKGKRRRALALTHLLDDYRIFSQARNPAARLGQDFGVGEKHQTNGADPTNPASAEKLRKTAAKAAKLEAKLRNVAAKTDTRTNAKIEPEKQLPTPRPPTPTHKTENPAPSVRRTATPPPHPKRLPSNTPLPVSNHLVQGNEDVNGYLKP